MNCTKWTRHAPALLWRHSSYLTADTLTLARRRIRHRKISISSRRQLLNSIYANADLTDARKYSHGNCQSNSRQQLIELSHRQKCMHARTRCKFNNVQKLSDKCKCKLVECSANSTRYMQQLSINSSCQSNLIISTSDSQTVHTFRQTQVLQNKFPRL